MTHAGGRSGRAAAVAACGLVAVAVIAPWALRGAWATHSVVGFLGLLVSVALVLTGASLTSSPDGAASGWWTLVAGILWLPNNTGIGQSGLGPYLNWCVSAIIWVPIALSISSYPRGGPWSREHRWWFVVAVVYLGPGCSALAVLGRPEWSGFDSSSWWPSLVASRPLFTVAVALSGVLYVVLALWFVRITLRRLRSLSDVDRSVLLPALYGTAITALAGSVASLVQNVVLTPEAWAATIVVQGVGLMTLPALVALTAHRVRATRGRVADLVLLLHRSQSALLVEELLRQTLGDVSLDVVYRTSPPGRYLDHSGAPARAPDEDRLVLPVQGADGETIALVSTDPRLRTHAVLVTTAVAAAGFVLENARLTAELRARIAELESSRAGIVDAQRAERERVADDLHDGLQQALLGLAARARAMQATTDQVDVREAADAVAVGALRAVVRVRDTARGLSSSVLRGGGLEEALAEVTDHLDLEVELDVVATPHGERVKDVAYMWVSDALAHAAHARATRARVVVRHQDEDLMIDITDDVSGTRTAECLRALRRRAEMADGTLVLTSTQEGGTALTVLLPDPRPPVS